MNRNKSNPYPNPVVASGPSSAPPAVISTAKPLEFNDFDNPLEFNDFDFSPDFELIPQKEYRQTFHEFPDPLLWNNTIDGIRLQANSYDASTQIHVFQDFDLVVTDAATQYAQTKTTFICVYITNLLYSDLSRKIVTSCSYCSLQLFKGNN